MCAKFWFSVIIYADVVANQFPQVNPLAFNYTWAIKK